MTEEQSNLLDTWISHIDPQTWDIEDQMDVHEANERIRAGIAESRVELHERPLPRWEFE